MFDRHNIKKELKISTSKYASYKANHLNVVVDQIKSVASIFSLARFFLFIRLSNITRTAQNSCKGVTKTYRL